MIYTLNYTRYNIVKEIVNNIMHNIDSFQSFTNIIFSFVNQKIIEWNPYQTIKLVKQMSQSIMIVLSEWIKMKCKKTDTIGFIKHTVTRLSRVNMLYIKFFQWITSSIIYENDELKKIFLNLSEKVEYTDNDIDYATLLGIVNEKKIKLDSLSPINSGTISLIYKGIMNIQEKPIVIKLLRNNIEKTLKDSLHFFDIITYLTSFVPYLYAFHFNNIIRENTHILLEQQNFTKEIDNMERFKDAFKDSSYVVIPNVYTKYTNLYPSAIVMDFIQGKTVYELTKEERYIYYVLLCDFIVECMLDHNLFHGDLHTGNILFLREEGEEGPKYKLGILDYGITYFYNDEIKEYVFRFFKHHTFKEFELMFIFLIEVVSKKKNVNITTEYETNVIVNELMKYKIEYNLLQDEIKSNDLYFINHVLAKYNLYLSLEFSKILMSTFSLYSLVTILKDSTAPKEEYILENAIKRYINKVSEDT